MRTGYCRPVRLRHDRRYVRPPGLAQRAHRGGSTIRSTSRTPPPWARHRPRPSGSEVVRPGADHGAEVGVHSFMKPHAPGPSRCPARPRPVPPASSARTGRPALFRRPGLLLGPTGVVPARSCSPGRRSPTSCSPTAPTRPGPGGHAGRTGRGPAMAGHGRSVPLGWTAPGGYTPTGYPLRAAQVRLHQLPVDHQRDAPARSQTSCTDTTRP